MNESENNFRDLKRLLKLKRHEVPPPGFFNNFSDGVIARIRENKTAGHGNFAERLNDHAPWLVSFLRIFEAKPGVIGGFATSLCLLLVTGVMLAERSETTPQEIFTTAATAPASTIAPVENIANSTLATPAAGSQFADSASAGGITISTNASLQPVTGFFGQPGQALFQTASFAPAH